MERCRRQKGCISDGLQARLYGFTATMLSVTYAAGRHSRNVGSFLRKELGDSPEDRSEELSKDLTPLSSGACGATPFLRKGALALSHAAVVTQKVIP